MGKRLIVATAGILCFGGVHGSDQYKTWQTPMQCGDIKAKILVICAQNKKRGELNSCKQPQKMQFLGKDNEIVQELNLPLYGKNEVDSYKKAGTNDSLFAQTWACIKLGSAQFFRINYATGTGHTEFDEKIEYYTADGQPVVSEKQQDKLGVMYDNDVRKDKYHSIKGAFPE